MRVTKVYSLLQLLKQDQDGEVPISETSSERQSPIRSTTAPYEEVIISPFYVNVEFNRNHHERNERINESPPQELFGHDSRLVSPAKTETTPYEDVTWPPLGYTQLDRNQQNEINDSPYQKLVTDNSGYAIPYRPSSGENVENTESPSGYTKLDKTKREPDDNDSYQKLIKR